MTKPSLRSETQALPQLIVTGLAMTKRRRGRSSRLRVDLH